MNDIILGVNEEISSMEQELVTTGERIKMAKLALHCFRECTSVTSQYVMVHITPEEFGIQAVTRTAGDNILSLHELSCFKSYCEKLGLEYKSFEFSQLVGYGTMQLKKLLRD